MYFSRAEVDIYMGVHRQVKAAFQGFLCNGSQHVSRHMMVIMSLLGPLRRACSGGALRERVRHAYDWSFTELLLLGIISVVITGCVLHWMVPKSIT